LNLALYGYSLLIMTSQSLSGEKNPVFCPLIPLLTVPVWSGAGVVVFIGLSIGGFFGQ